KQPAVQLGKEFHDSADGQDAIKHLNTEFSKVQETTYQNQLTAKKAELLQVSGSISHDAVLKRLTVTWNSAGHALRELRVVPRYWVEHFEPPPAVEGQPQLPAPPPVERVSFEAAPSWNIECASIKRDMLMWCNQVRQLAIAKHGLAAKRVEKKRKLKDTADAMVVDKPSGSGSNIQKTIQNEVNRAVKRLKIDNTKPGSSKPLPKGAAFKKDKKKSAPKSSKPPTPDTKGKGKEKKKKVAVDFETFKRLRAEAQEAKEVEEEQGRQYQRSLKAGLRRATKIMATFPGSQGS
ncbi:hypothetical protein M378DRAFT_19227, partial [Amanita muscaria Koide BX008]